MWQDYAACKGMEHIYFMEFGDNSRYKLKKARYTCNRCPVYEECLEFIKEQKDHYGIWAGLTPNERKSLGWW